VPEGPDPVGSAQIGIQLLREYKTRVRLLGLPLVHMAVRSRRSERPGVARGWIAIGERAFGRVIAAGNVAVGPIAIGSIGIGVLCTSLVGVGGFAGGAIVATGVWTYGGASLGAYAAQGGVSVAYRYADGIVAVAKNANDTVAERYFEQAIPFTLLHEFLDNKLLVLAVTALLLVPLWILLYATRQG